MIQTLKNSQLQPEHGGKINGLIQLIQLGLPVPDGIIITNTKDHTALKKELSHYLQEGVTYIVRSSGQTEDGVNASYAGQYTSVRDCRTLEAVLQGIKECLASQSQTQVEAYGQGLGLVEDYSPLAILVQEQIEADMSGIAFSLNPLNNHDQEILVETTQGAGDMLADGRVEPQRQIMAWHSPQTDQSFETLRQSILTAASHFGYPLDIEFCFSKGQLSLVQARPITRLAAKVSMGSWTTANFRDGGVAAQACPALMWSLYRDAWQVSLEAFMLENGLLADQEVYRLALIKYARPYWNVGLVKNAMSRIPGFIEREFDDELGIYKAYSGDGRTSQLTPKTLVQLAKVAQKISSSTRKHQTQAQTLKDDLLKRYADYEQSLLALTSTNSSVASVENLWRDIICEGHLASETSYFKQVFINTVQLSMKKTALLKHLSVEAFFQLISQLGTVSHLRPTTALQEISDRILADASLTAYWQDTTTDELAQEVQAAISHPANQRRDLSQLVEWFKLYGYHSERELNLLWPSFIETPATIIDKIKALLKSDRPKHSLNQALSSKEMDRILQSEAINPRHAKRIKANILSLRDLLWWREEFKDISTRYYHLIRQSSLLLGQHYSQQGVLDHIEDIFYLEKESLLQWMHQELSTSQLQTKVSQNRLYCQAYRHYQATGDLQAGPSTQLFQESINRLQGIGANDGVVTGRVRVLTEFSQLKQLEAGDILVTPFTDTGWSHRFATLKGLITETGGVLSHATIVAREFDLPAIIGAKGATSSLRTGMLIEMNGATGDIQILENVPEERR